MELIAVAEAYRALVVQHLADRVRKRYNLDLAETILQLSGLSVENLWAHLMSATPFEEPREFYRLEQPQWRRVYRKLIAEIETVE